MIRKTKIIATLGPVTDSPTILGRLLEAGVNVFRLNMSHAKHDWVRRVVRDIRTEAGARRLTVGLLLDTQGPAIRTGDVVAPIPLKAGDRFVFTVRGDAVEDVPSTRVNYDGFAHDVNTGDTLVIDNGAMKMRIHSKTESRVECEVLTDGQLGSRRHINLPGVRVSLPALTEKDHEDLTLGLELAVDYIAMSFVREPEDIRQLRARIAGSAHPPQIVAKIEHQFAVNNFDAIARESDAVMIARGDLGIECPYAELPIIQRRLVKKCQEMGRPVIVATQMLESMIDNPLPTRAEITDVANAVYEQADAIMLSAETTVGRHPLACIEVMDTIARRIERSGGAGYQTGASFLLPREKLVKNAVQLADDLRAAALLVLTRRGHLARYAARMRPRWTPIHVFSADPRVLTGLTLCRDLILHRAEADLANAVVATDAALAELKRAKIVQSGGTVVVVVGTGGNDRCLDEIRLRQIP